jgi:hypothetical protein
MAADFQFEVAVRHKVRENEGLGVACGRHWRRAEGVGRRKGRW